MKPDRGRTAILSTLAWIAVGGFVGLGVGLYSYWQRTPVFQSTAQVLIAKPAESDDLGVDDATLVVGLPTVRHAIKEHRLDLLFDQSEGESTTFLASRLTKRGALGAHRVEKTSQGHVYEVSFRTETPGVARQVVEAIIDASQESIENTSEFNSWNESCRILSEVRDQVNQRIDAITEELKQVELQERVVPVDGRPRSSAAVRWEMHQESLDSERELLDSMRKRRRSATQRMAEGATDSDVLRELKHPLSPSGQTQSPEAMRAEKLLDPLESELETALKRYGKRHPTVVAIEKQIDEIRNRYGLAEQQALIDAKAARWTSASDGLEFLAERINQSEQRIDELLSKLDGVAIDLAVQHRLSQRKERLEKALTQELLFRDEALSRLDQLPVAAPFPQTKLTVLRAPGDGVVVAPTATPIIGTSCIAGLLAGLGSGVIRLLSGVMNASTATEETTLMEPSTT